MIGLHVVRTPKRPRVTCPCGSRGMARTTFPSFAYDALRTAPKRIASRAVQGTGRPCRALIQRYMKGIAMNLVRIILSILIPPLGVFLKVGLGGQF